MKQKFCVGQVVYEDGGHYVRITHVTRENGQIFYTTEFEGDNDYDYIAQEDMRALRKKERGN